MRLPNKEVKEYRRNVAEYARNKESCKHSSKLLLFLIKENGNIDDIKYHATRAFHSADIVLGLMEDRELKRLRVLSKFQRR